MIRYTGDITNTLKGKRQAWYNQSIGWVSIPKNANMQFRKIMSALKAPRTDFKSYDDLPEKMFCVWRDPRTRLISGIGEYSARRRSKRGLGMSQYTEYLEQLLKDPTQFDEHLEPQIVYTHSIVFTDVIRFENLLEDTLKVLPEHEALVTKNLNPEKTRRSKHTNLSISEVIEHNKKLIDSVINKYYSVDMEIFNNHNLIKDKQKVLTI